MLRSIYRAVGPTLLGAAALCCGPAQAQTYPERPITIVVPFAAGSGTDQQVAVGAQEAADHWRLSICDW